MTTAALLVSGILPFRAMAADAVSATSSSGDWAMTEVSQEASGWRFEAFKVDRDLLAWVETNDALELRRLFVFDGIATRLIANIPAIDWDIDRGQQFFDPVKGSFDVADGTLVWVMNDGIDREVFRYRDGVVTQISNNDFDDSHPVTSRGRIAWTGHPGSAYHLMLDDARGVSTAASYHVMNYAFSGPNLYWLNRLPNETWFRVFVDNGSEIPAIGKGDDRPIIDYFLVDGNGSAAWEYSTKNWSYDKRVIYASHDGAAATTILKRDVPPHVTHLEDVRDGKVLVNSTDLLTTMWYANISLILSDGATTKTLKKDMNETKALFTDEGMVRHVVPATSSALLYRTDAGFEDYVSVKTVIHELYDADGDTVAAALLEGGVMLYRFGNVEIIPSEDQATDIATRNSSVAWIEGETGSRTLNFASPTIGVRKTDGTAGLIDGHLVKTDGSSTVYLAGDDGNRYVFPGEGQFYSWYPGFESLTTLAADELAAMPLGGTVLYRPKSSLIKTAISPEVYLVADSGVLHWVTDAQVLEDLYGEEWHLAVDVMPEAFLVDYEFGDPVGNVIGYHMALVE